MRFSRIRGRTAAVVVGGLLAGSLAGVGISSVAVSALHGPSTHRTSLLATSAAAYPVNQLGESYGSAMGVSEPSQGPELVATVADNGVSGYVLQSQLTAASGGNV